MSSCTRRCPLVACLFYVSMHLWCFYVSFITLDTMNCYIHTVLFETKNIIKVLSLVCVLHVFSSRVMFHAAALFCSSDVKQKKGEINKCLLFEN